MLEKKFKMYPTISIDDPNFSQLLLKGFKKYGVIVINDIFTEKQCNKYMSNLIKNFEQLETGIDQNDIKNTWINYNLPPQTRPGLF